MTTEGKKFDAGKDPWDLAPWDAFQAIIKVLAFGAKKYEPRNWELGSAWSRQYSATLRHLTAWWGGENKDPDSGFSHLAHAGCCVCFMLAYEIRGVGKDDRPNTATPATPFYIGVDYEKLGSDQTVASPIRISEERLVPRPDKTLEERYAAAKDHLRKGETRGLRVQRKTDGISLGFCEEYHNTPATRPGTPEDGGHHEPKGVWINDADVEHKTRFVTNSGVLVTLEQNLVGDAGLYPYISSQDGRRYSTTGKVRPADVKGPFSASNLDIAAKLL